MKIKQGFYGAVAIGGAAGVLRVLQYIFTIDSEGYYQSGPLSDFFSGMLIGILAAGVLWCLYSGWKKKEPLSFESLFTGKLLEKICFAVLGIAAVIDGIWRLASAGGKGILVIAALLIIAGGAAWILLAVKGTACPAALGILPVLQLIAMILLYFWETYKFIQVSEYALVTFGLCAACYFVLLIMKVLADADCTKGRLTTAACLVLVLSGAAFIAPLAGGLSLSSVILLIEGICLILLAALVLKQLPHAKAPEEPQESPDLSQLDEYISNIPDVEENENENT